MCILSGKHGTEYINKDAFYPYTIVVSGLCEVIAQSFMFDGVEAVIAPVIGGVILSQWTAHHLSEMRRKEVLSVYAKKTYDYEFVIRRRYEKMIAGKNILVIDDVCTTGGTIKKVIQTTRDFGANIVCFAVLCNRGGIKAEYVANLPKFISFANIANKFIARIFL